MSNFVWTPEIDAELLRLKGEKKTAKEIAYALGTNEKSVGNRLYWLKKKTESPSAVASNEGTAVKSGELSELESVLAETIKELTGEKAALVDEIAGLKILLAEEREKNRCLAERYGQERAAVTIDLENLRRETDEARSLLEQTEKQYDNACVEAKVQFAKVKDQADIISRLEGQVKDLTERLERMCSVAQTDAERNKGQIKDLNWRLERAAKEAGRLYELLLLTETQSTFSPFCEE